MFPMLCITPLGRCVGFSMKCSISKPSPINLGRFFTGLTYIGHQRAYQFGPLVGIFVDSHSQTAFAQLLDGHADMA